MAARAETSADKRQSGVKAEQASDPEWAWARYEPTAQRPWNLVRAGHLYRRATFGADWNQLTQALADGPQRTIDRLLRPDADIDEFNGAHDEYETAAGGSTDGLRAWWLRRMIQTPHALLEKMTLFWHSHFGISAARVKDARLMRAHIGLLRRHALGSFRALVEGIARDPAVLVGLDADANRKARPNENLPRSLIETFTLGPGHHTEEDIRQAAKAFTGWFVLRGRLRFIEREHDTGAKQIFGQQGDFTADDVVRLTLEQPATAQTLVSKLYRWLICETQDPHAALIAPLARSCAKDYDISAVAETMLRSNLFFSAAAYRRRIKCPVEFALGIIRSLEEMVSTTHLAQDLADIGQNLYYPPTTKGWPGGRHWINDATLIGRHNLALALLRGSKPYGDKLNPRAVATKHGHATADVAKQFLLDLFVQDDLDPDVRDSVIKTTPASVEADRGDPAAALRGFAQAVVTLPEFQLA